jgi:alkanesulfonate monooxygenase SsuD/methylene tetrahydromethanopterin reductase-like flavin-dependent oxidoreductase (luciferase family)
VDLAARYGDPLFSANVTSPIDPYAELIDHYRERWEHYGHDPADALVGAGSAGLCVAERSQDAVETYRPVFNARLELFRRNGITPVFHSLEDAIERSSILIGSPQQIIDKVHRYHDRFGHEVMHVQADADGLTDARHRAPWSCSWPRSPLSSARRSRAVRSPPHRPEGDHDSVVHP